MSVSTYLNIFSKDPQSLWGRRARPHNPNSNTTYGQLVYTTPLTLLVLAIGLGIYLYLNPGPNGGGTLLQLIGTLALVWVGGSLVFAVTFLILASLAALSSRQE